jgi:superfamily II DNA or RNA helicase
MQVLRSSSSCKRRRDELMAENTALKKEVISAGGRRPAASDPINLRPYQAAPSTRCAPASGGHRKQFLVAPTGAGKTEIAMALVQEAERKFSRTAFIIDRVSLCDQTSQRYDVNGIAHGVIQADHWRWKPYERHQICSVQTLARRGSPKAPRSSSWTRRTRCTA